MSCLPPCWRGFIMQSKLLRRSQKQPQRCRPPYKVRPSRKLLNNASSRSLVPNLRRSSGINVRSALFEAGLWVLGAVAIRLVLDAFMSVSSQFWLLGAMVACLPAFTAILMTHLSPQRGFIVGYRCLLVMAGLLLGGKFGGFS